MSNRHGLVDTILDSLVPVHSDGHKFIAIAGALSLLFFILWAPLGWILLVVALYIAYFFRDPERVTPLREGLVVMIQVAPVSPASRMRGKSTWL